MKRRIVALSIFMITGWIGSHSYAAHAGIQAGSLFPVTIVDDLGNHVTVAHKPTRIISLDPRDTETLFALGLEGRIVADGTHGEGGEGASGINRPFKYPTEWPSRWGRDYPIRARKITGIEGGCCGKPFDLELITSLQSDVIFSLDTDRPTLQKMRDLGLKVIVLNPANLQGILHDITLVGRVTGATKQATTVTATIRHAVSTVQTALKHVRTHPLTYYEIDATNPTQPYVAGPGTYIDEAIKLAGGKNVAAGVTFPGCPGTECYPSLSLEALIKLDPQVILLGDAAYGTTVQSVKARTGWSTISAIRTGKVYPFNDELVSRAGPRIAIGIQYIAIRIHPEAFGRSS